uniref:DUF6783 domain-containing protein n=1 Tax=Enterocloster hominis (ex Hitch et al. 2024) TaxID=1917870 RepID=UPI0010313247
MKIHSRHLHAPLRGIFGPDSVGVAHYASIIGTKSPTKWDAHLTESNFQTRPRITIKIILEGCPGRAALFSVVCKKQGAWYNRGKPIAMGQGYGR